MTPEEERMHRKLRDEQLRSDMATAGEWPKLKSALSARQQARINEICKTLEKALNEAERAAGV